MSNITDSMAVAAIVQETFDSYVRVFIWNIDSDLRDTLVQSLVITSVISELFALFKDKKVKESY